MTLTRGRLTKEQTRIAPCGLALRLQTEQPQDFFDPEFFLQAGQRRN